MKFKRSAGILLHPTSLPGKYGIGDIGPEAYNFIDFMVAAGQTIWQVCPLGPTGYGDSPYQCFSAFAGNPNLISPDLLKKANLLDEMDLTDVPEVDLHKVDFGEVINFKKSLLNRAFENFKSINDSAVYKEFNTFCKKQSFWLNDYSLFMATKEHHGGVQWTEWKRDIALRKDGAVEAWTKKLSDKILYQKFVQFFFFEQWGALKRYANAKGIKIIGDLPLFIAFDSSDLWANKELFSVDKSGKLLSVAGVPPDYFSPTGQLWGNPLYRWDVMEKDDFKWWRDRISSINSVVDVIRIDHFRGLEAYWKIPGNALTAQTGKWTKAPGDKLFAKIREYLGDVPILAEDLGVITKEVETLRDKYEFPGMKILQFAFGSGMEKKFMPHNYVNNCVVYTGSHDNDTTRGFFEEAKNQQNDIFSSVQNYLGSSGENIAFDLIRLAYSSIANLVIIPMQDILNLDSSARMNFPGKLGGNWNWRFSWDQVDINLAKRFEYLTNLFERVPLAKVNSSTKK